MNFKTKQLVAVGLSIAGAVGTIGTAVLARKAALKEVNLKSKIKNFDSLPLKEKLLLMYKYYIPTSVVGVATITSIVASTVMSRKAEASIMSMAVLADQSWRRYKNQVKNALGFDTHEDLLTKLSKKDQVAVNEYLKKTDDDRKELYYDEIIGYFVALPEDVMYAYAKINEILIEGIHATPTEVFTGVSLWSFLQFANAKVIDQSITQTTLESFGWSMDYLHDNFGNMWVHMKLNEDATMDGIEPTIKYKVISWAEDPILIGSEDYEERFDLRFEPSVEEASYEMFGVTKVGPDGKLAVQKNPAKTKK